VICIDGYEEKVNGPVACYCKDCSAEFLERGCVNPAYNSDLGHGIAGSEASTKHEEEHLGLEECVSVAHHGEVGVSCIRARFAIGLKKG